MSELSSAASRTAKRHRINELTPVYGADFETDSDEAGTCAWIAQWSVSNGTRNFHGPVTQDGSCPEPGTALRDFESFLFDLLDAKEGCCLYFHNLKFDAQFLRATFAGMAALGVRVEIMMRMGSPTSITIEDEESGHWMVIRDSMKKVPGDLRSLGRTVGLAKLDPPGEDFSPGWSRLLDYSEGSTDWRYIDRDAGIPAVSMRRMHLQGRIRATASGDAWRFAKGMINTTPEGRFSDKWKKLFPRIPLELDTTWRRGYFGGLNLSQWQGHNVTDGTQDSEARQTALEGEGTRLYGTHAGECITHEDVHSMYPTVMSYDPLPVGLPTETHVWPSDRFLWIGCLRLKLKLKEGRIPWFRFKNSLDNIMEQWPSDALVEETYCWHEMVLTSVDLATISNWYDVEFDESYQPTFWVFQPRTGLFRPYIQYWFAEKEKQPKGSLEYVSAKLMMNSLYGRFALSPETEVTSLEYVEEVGDFVFRSDPGLNEDNDAYLPMAMFITAHARARLLANVEAVGPENVIHSDTDSVIHFGPPSRDIMHGDALGTWGIESRPVEIYEGGFKRYLEVLRRPIRSVKDVSVACAGVPQKLTPEGVPIGMWVELLDKPERITWTGHVLGHADYRIESEWLRELYIEHGMDPDRVNTYKLIPKRVRGGVILEERQHALTDNMIRRMRMI